MYSCLQTKGNRVSTESLKARLAALTGVKTEYCDCYYQCACREGGEELRIHAPTDLAAALEVVEAAKDTLETIHDLASELHIPRSERICSALHVALDAWEALP